MHIYAHVKHSLFARNEEWRSLQCTRRAIDFSKDQHNVCLRSSLRVCEPATMKYLAVALLLCGLAIAAEGAWEAQESRLRSADDCVSVCGRAVRCFCAEVPQAVRVAS